jgi:hypothetical protein
MTAPEAIREIEGKEFAARLNLASDLRMFLAAAEHEEAISSLARLASDRRYQELLWERLVRACRLSPDHRYRHPLDAAIGVYVWLLNRVSSPLYPVASELLRRVENLMWALRIARSLSPKPNPADESSRELSPASATVDARRPNTSDTVTLAEVLWTTLQREKTRPFLDFERRAQDAHWSESQWRQSRKQGDFSVTSAAEAA